MLPTKLIHLLRKNKPVTVSSLGCLPCAKQFYVFLKTTQQLLCYFTDEETEGYRDEIMSLSPSIWSMADRIQTQCPFYLGRPVAQVSLSTLPLFFFVCLFIHLLICAYIVWAISPRCCPHPSHFQAEPGLPSSPILFKRRHKQ
jgi:hypothetical protein